MRQKAAATFFFSSWLILTGAGCGFLWLTGWPQDCRQKRMFYLNTFHPLALLNTTEIVFCALNWGGGGWYHNQQVTWARCYENRAPKQAFTGAGFYRFKKRKPFLKFLQGGFSNSQVLNSSPQIASSIPWTWIPKKVFGFLWHRRVKASNNCYGEEWKEMKTSLCAPWERLVVG